MRVARTDPRILFEAKVDRTTTPDGCHTWTAAMSGSGYGSFKMNGKTHSAHVAALILEGVNVLDTDDGDHRCKNPLCIRVHPEHVQALDAVTNRGEFNRKKTHCPQGHEYSEENTYFYLGKWKRCRICHRESARESYRRSRSADIEKARA